MGHKVVERRDTGKKLISVSPDSLNSRKVYLSFLCLNWIGGRSTIAKYSNIAKIEKYTPE